MLKVIILCCILALTHGATTVRTFDGTTTNTESADDIKTVLRVIAERLDQWDSFYLHRLEPRMVGAATSLANLDTNIRNLQERAHVWDTFQLHVASWNDQIKALDHKINIINEGYEKLLSLDTKLHTTLKPNGSLQLIDTYLKKLDDKLESMSPPAVHDPHPPILNEFAGRGVLHAIKVLERKMDRLQVTADRMSRVAKHGDMEESREQLIADRMTVQCSTPPMLEELLRDVSSKVDSLFDRSAGEEVDLIPETKFRHSDQSCKRLVAPFRKLTHSVEQIRNVIQDAFEVEPMPVEKSMGLRKRPMSGFAEIKDTLEDIEKRIINLGKDQHRNVNENERILRRIERKIDEIDEEEEDDEEEIKKFVKQLVKDLKKDIAKIDDDDDSDEKKDNDDSDDDDDDDTRERKGGRRKKGDDSDDDSDDDDDDTRERKGGKKHNKDDSDSDDDDDDDDTKERKGGKRGKDSDNDSDDDDDDDDSKGGNGRRKKGDDDSDDDSDEDNTKERKQGKKKIDDDDSDDDDDDDDSQARLTTVPESPVTHIKV